MRLVTLIGSVCLLAACGSDDDAENDDAGNDDGHDQQWQYEGDHGPDHWGDLDGYMTCGEGEEQSPVALTSDLSAEDLDDLELDYDVSGVSIVNNGHTVQYDYDAGSTLGIGDSTYELLQFHFHAPSEHTLDGEAFPMEVHFVHRSEDSEFAVLGVFIEEGDENEMLRDAQWEQLPTEDDATHVDDDAMLNAFELIPGGDSYRYDGSLTTPPCSEGLAWHVFAEPITLSEGQISRFTDIHSGSARPVQELHDRSIRFGQ